MTKLNVSTINLFACNLILCVGLLAGAYFFEYVMNLEPCILCLAQRWMLFAIAFYSILALIHRPAQFGTRVYALLMLIPSTLGLYLAGRQVWLQQLPPDNVPACSPSLEYMLAHFSYSKIVNNILHAAGDCAKDDWRLLGLTLAGWMLVFFTIFCLTQIYVLLRGRAGAQ